MVSLEAPGFQKGQLRPQFHNTHEKFRHNKREVGVDWIKEQEKKKKRKW